MDNDNGVVVQIDNLFYTYNNNQLAAVYDESNSTNGFKDGNLNSTDYEYDANGNMIVDRNKGIVSIYYNHLNLPTSIGFENEKSISYLYNAVGVKLGKTVDDLVTQVTTNYLSGFQYSTAAPQDPYNGLQFFPHAEGYVDVYEGQFNYVYNYTDHLGNIRLSYGLDKNNVLKIIEENNYYPFGLKHDNYNLQKADFVPIDIVGPIDLNPPVEVKPVAKNSFQYKYQGQERQDELGLNWDSFKWRNYDFTIGRFMSIDPLTEEYEDYTPYQFSSNQPVHARELEGLESSNDINKRKTLWERGYNPSTGNTDGFKILKEAFKDLISQLPKAGTERVSKVSKENVGTTVTSDSGGNKNPKTKGNSGEIINVDGFLNAAPGAEKTGNAFKNVKNGLEFINDVISGSQLGAKTAEKAKEVVNDAKKETKQEKVKAQDSIKVQTWEKGQMIKEEVKAKKDVN